VTGEIHSKVTGAQWALPRLPEHLRPCLEHALAAYGGAPEEWDETLRREYVDYVTREIKRG
jgi:hypothetical protein